MSGKDIMQQYVLKKGSQYIVRDAEGIIKLVNCLEDADMFNPTEDIAEFYKSELKQLQDISPLELSIAVWFLA